MNTERKSSCVKCQIIASNYFHIEWKHMFCCHPRHIKYSNFPVKNWVSFPGPFRTSWLVWCLSKTLLTFVYMCIYTHIAVLIYNSTFSFQYWLKKVNSIKGKKKKKKKEVPKPPSQPTADTAKKQQVSGQPPYRFPLVLFQQSVALQSIVSPSQAVFSLGKCGLLFSIWFSFYKTSVNEQAMRQTYTIQ